MLFAIAALLMAGALGLGGWLYAMDASAHVAPSPTVFGQKGPAEVEAIDANGFAQVDWDYWRGVNPDIVAWVNVPGTAINYPVMRSPAEDPTFYLHHDIYKNYSAYGVPYLDAESDTNAIIYGHHMDNGSMFSDFAKFSNVEFAQSHATVYLQTPEEKTKLKVRFVNIIDGETTYKTTHFSSADVLRVWFEEQYSNAKVKLGLEAPVVSGESDEVGRWSGLKEQAEEEHQSNEEGRPSEEEPQQPEENRYSKNYVVTFCTCSYSTYVNERTLVVCVPAEE